MLRGESVMEKNMEHEMQTGITLEFKVFAQASVTCPCGVHACQRSTSNFVFARPDSSARLEQG